MNKYLSVTALVLSLFFASVLLLEINGANLSQYSLINLFDWIFGIPLYILVLVSLGVSTIYWLNDKKQTRYIVYSLLSFFITFGTLFYILLEFARTMSDFD